MIFLMLNMQTADVACTSIVGLIFLYNMRTCSCRGHLTPSFQASIRYLNDYCRCRVFISRGNSSYTGLEAAKAAKLAVRCLYIHVVAVRAVALMRQTIQHQITLSKTRVRSLDAAR